MREIVIVSACRTALAKFQGSLSSVKSTDLGAHVIKEALKRADVKPDMVDEVIMGCVLQAGLGQNPARQALIHAGIPNTVGATTINKVCGSGLKAVIMAAQAIKAEDCDLIVAGGMENMSQAPYIMRKARDGFRMGHGQIDDLMVADGLWDVYNDFHMGSTAELVSREFKIDRETQDKYAYNSQVKASKAQKSGKFKKEITPFEVKLRKKTFIFEEDEGIKHDVTLEGLAKPRAAFEKDGTVTAGNASTINDGASAIVVTHREFAEKNNLKIMATIKAYETGGMAPEWVMMAPKVAIEKLYKKADITKDDVDLFEINEAFSVASVALINELKLDSEKINVNGGAVALGHPIGASGARILTTLLHSLEDLDKKTGIAALCLGGGNAVAMLIERNK
ncbi:MAG: acetyl-CoA C-acyltransferase [Candidatus Cloacimonadota bacterium]|nr:MAG: acetyl-CoA C-acyltransferase [Candidatus Cloacimonadota bacterium]